MAQLLPTRPHDRFQSAHGPSRATASATQEWSAGAHGGRVLCDDRDHALGVDTSPLAERRGHEFDVAGPARRSSPRT
jgi:hypothetical protein